MVTTIHLLAPTHVRGELVLRKIQPLLPDHRVVVITSADRLMGLVEPEVWVLDTCTRLERAKASLEMGCRRGTLRVVFEQRLLRGTLPE